MAVPLHAAPTVDPALCGDLLRLPPRPPIEIEDTDPEATYMSADEADLSEEGVSRLRGNVHIRRKTTQLLSERAYYDKTQEVFDAEEDVNMWDEGLFLTASRGRMELKTDLISADDVTFIIMDKHGRGTAKQFNMSGSDLIRVHDGTYTTCNPGDETWLLEARQLKLNKIIDVGTARDVKVKFKGVPVFYSPYLTFPLSDKRKSGFLAPAFRASGPAGMELIVPYYWNIAPNYDATFTARGMSERGLLGQGEFRYLTRRGQGQLSGELLPHDSETKDARGALRFIHRGSFAPRWHTDINFNTVSDKNYFEDLGTNLAIAATQFQERRGDLTYSGRGWASRLRLQSYQTLDETIAGSSRPYERLPQFLVWRSRAERNRRLNFRFTGELVNFERTASVHGLRADLRPTVSFPMRSAGSFLVPSLALRHTRYDLDGTSPGEPGDPERTLPTFSLDSGLFLERSYNLGARSYLQTLEPRVYYLFTPLDNQSDLPVFDTGLYSFNFAQLFRDDRFSGADRVSDANQATLALTSRLLNPAKGEELARASVGQIRYFRDREVTLPGALPETEGSSDIVAEVSAKLLGSWRVSGGLQWDVDDQVTDKSTVNLRYQPDARRVANFGYRFVRNLVEQTDVSFRWPLNTNWSALGRWNHSIPDEQLLEAVAGVEYNSCCWAARAVARRYLTNTQGEFANAFFFQVELKGLAGYGGDSTVTFLRESIPGYQNEF